MRAGVLLLGLCGLLGQQWGVQPGGKPLPSLGGPATRAVVLFFVASDCPISNRTFPEMRRLREKYSGQGVQSWYVYPNAGEQADTIAEHQHAFDPTGQPLQDPAGTLVRLTHAVATPEMSVLVRDRDGWRPVYAGKVDDRYVRLGLERPAITEHYGEEAIEAALAGKTPHPATTQPVGCAIMSAGARP